MWAGRASSTWCSWAGLRTSEQEESTVSAQFRVRAGQEYLSCVLPRSSGEAVSPQVRIRIVEDPQSGWHKADIVTVRSDGRAVNPRRIEISQLHASATTRRGTARKTGYYLSTGAPVQAAASAAAHPHRVRLFGGRNVHAARTAPAGAPPEPSASAPTAQDSAGTALFDLSSPPQHQPPTASVTACGYHLHSSARNHWLAGTSPVTCPACARAMDRPTRA